MRCFVIGPIGDQLAEPGTADRTAYEEAVQIFEEVIKAACAEFDIEAYRADEIDDPGDIPEQIFEALRDEKLVIADLTGANPNVMYELGIRHITGKCTLQVGEAGRLPFDINTIRTVQFKRTPAGFIAARKKLNALIGSTLANGCKPPVAARVIGAVVGQSADQAFDESEASAVEGVALEATEEHPGVLDAIVDLETGLPEMQSRAESMTSLINDISSLTSTYAEKLDRATKPTQKLALVRSYARELDPLAREYDEEAVEFDSRVTTNGLAVDTLLEHSDAEGEPVEGRQDLLVSLQSMAEAAHDARTKGLAGFYASLGNIERMSRDLRPVIHLLRRALQRTMQDFEAIEAWGERSRAA